MDEKDPDKNTHNPSVRSASDTSTEPSCEQATLANSHAQNATNSTTEEPIASELTSDVAPEITSDAAPEETEKNSSDPNSITQGSYQEESGKTDEISTADITLRFDATLSQKFLDSLTFPLELHINGDDIPPNAPAAHASESPASAQANDGSDDLTDVLVEDMVTEPLADHLEGIRQAQQQYSHRQDSHQQDPDIAIFDHDPTDNPVQEKRYQLILRSLSVVIPESPTLCLGNPVTLQDVHLKVRADIKVGVRILGKWRWMETQTPWLDLNGRNAKLHLNAQGSKLSVLPELEKTAMKFPLKIWKWPLTCQLRVSKWINRQLQKKGPYLLVDLADFHQGKTFLGKTPVFDICSVDNRPDCLELKANITWV